jgi:hypothetical protein
MTDVYVYCFIDRDGPAETNGHARPRATLETIKAIGDPIMESQIVVDDAELDSRGFFLGSVANDSRPSEDVRNEIRSLNLRAAARDREGLILADDDDAAGSAHKYMLQLESRELRKQSKKLQRQCDDAAAQSDHQAGAPEFGQLDASATAG